MHYYKRNIGDYAKKAGKLSMLEHGAYTLLLDACYDREVFPTMEDAIDWCWARTEAEIEAVKFVLRKFFSLEGDRYVQNRVREEVEAFQEKSKTNSRIATEREAKRTKRARNVHETSPEEHEAPPNQEPRTNNQENIDKVTKGESVREGMAVAPTSPKNVEEPVDGLNEEAWQAWELYRKKIKKPIKPASMQLAKRRLAAHGDMQMQVVEQSIANGYQGLFEVKNQVRTPNQEIEHKYTAAARVIFDGVFDD